MAKQTIQIIQRTLGLDPFVLVQLEAGEDDGMSMQIEFGGGPSSEEDVRLVLLGALEQLGVTQAEVEQLREVAR